MASTDHVWFDLLAPELKQHLWDHRSEPLSAQVMVALLESTNSFPEVEIEYAADGLKFDSRT